MAVPIVSQWLTNTIKESLFEGMVLPSVCVAMASAELESLSCNGCRHATCQRAFACASRRGQGTGEKMVSAANCDSVFCPAFSGLAGVSICGSLWKLPVFEEAFNFVAHVQDAYLLRAEVLPSGHGAGLPRRQRRIRAQFFASGSVTLSRLEPRRRKACKLPLVSESLGGSTYRDLVLTWRPLRMVEAGEDVCASPREALLSSRSWNVWGCDQWIF